MKRNKHKPHQGDYPCLGRGYFDRHKLEYAGNVPNGGKNRETDTYRQLGDALCLTVGLGEKQRATGQHDSGGAGGIERKKHRIGSGTGGSGQGP